MLEPMTRVEKFLARIAGDPATVLEPKTRIETFLQRIIDVLSGGGGGGADSNAVHYTADSGKSASEKAQARGNIGALSQSDLAGYQQKATVETVSGSTPTITPADNTVYTCGELTSLTISNPPATGEYSIVFTSGGTATATTIPATILGLEDFAAEANTLYEINVLDNRAVVGSWAVNSGE